MKLATVKDGDDFAADIHLAQWSICAFGRPNGKRNNSSYLVNRKIKQSLNASSVYGEGCPLDRLYEHKEV